MSLREIDNFSLLYQYSRALRGLDSLFSLELLEEEILKRMAG